MGVDSVVRRDQVRLDFSIEFLTWVIVHNFKQPNELATLCNGWEL